MDVKMAALPAITVMATIGIAPETLLRMTIFLCLRDVTVRFRPSVRVSRRTVGAGLEPAPTKTAPLMPATGFESSNPHEGAADWTAEGSRSARRLNRSGPMRSQE